MTKIVLVESPFHHEKEWGRALHAAYLEACLFDCLKRGEVPIATHKLYTRALDDLIPEERQMGMDTITAFSKHVETHVIYFDLGISRGMWWGIEFAIKNKKHWELRSLYNHHLPHPDACRMADLRHKIDHPPRNVEPDFDVDFYINKHEGGQR